MTAPDDEPPQTLREIAQHSRQQALEALRKHVANRQATFERFEHLDPSGKLSRDARVLLDKARSEYRIFALSIGAEPDPAAAGDSSSST